MNSRIFADYIVLKRSLLFFIVAISTTFVSLSEKSDACRCDNSQGETSFSEIVPQNIFFSDCCFDLSDILPVHHILDTDKNPLASKKNFSYIRFHNDSRSDTTYTSVCNFLYLNQFRSKVLLI
jgi:hypothetical protein